MSDTTVAPKGRKRGPYYYLCQRKIEEKRKSGCPNRNHRAEPLEERVRGFAVHLIRNPEVLGLVEEYLADLPNLMGPEIRVRKY